jgi:hypothetical protein
VPLAASDLRSLAVRTGVVAAYVSLGVVEHDPDGRGAILAEASRVLAPGGRDRGVGALPQRRAPAGRPVDPPPAGGDP